MKNMNALLHLDLDFFRLFFLWNPDDTVVDIYLLT